MHREVIFTSKRFVIAVLALSLFVAYAFTIGKVWRADWLQHRPDLSSLQASAHSVPWNAQTQWMLGRYSLNATQDYITALTFLQRAVDLNPHVGRYWLDLAAAHQVAADGESRKALEQALHAEPTSSEIAWETANFYLAQNDIEHALPLLRTASQHDPKFAVPAIELSWRVTKNVTRTVHETDAQQPSSYLAFLKILVAQNQPSAAAEVWNDIVTSDFHFPADEAFPYFDYLIRSQQIDQARKVWADLIRIHPELSDDTTVNLVSNGGFERDFVNGGFGWRKRDNDSANMTIDFSEFHGGARSLRFAFSGPAVAAFGPYQFIPVQPGTKYRFGAYVKTRDVTTASGPRLAIADPATGKVLATTDEFLETSAWSRHTSEFVSPADARVLTVQLMRIPSNLLIKGTFWLDDVEVAVAASASP